MQRLHALRDTQRSWEHAHSQTRCGRGSLPHHPSSVIYHACCKHDHKPSFALLSFWKARLSHRHATCRDTQTCAESKHIGARNVVREPTIAFDSPASATIRWLGKAATSSCKGCVRCRLMGGFEAYLEASPGSPGWPDGLRRQGRRHSLMSARRQRDARTTGHPKPTRDVCGFLHFPFFLAARNTT